ncbi:MAG: hypothetical protein OEV64_11705 [Desulfobulbaceae bacterium]|nr:hypothetical protein [Desulfobulbaceae bacterium]
MIIGTDLSGKNHVANLLVEELLDNGLRVEKREGKFSARATTATTSEDKSAPALFAEWAFIRTFALHHRLIPHVVTHLIKKDLRKFRPTPDRVTLVISHTPLRVLAFYLAHLYERKEDIRLPAHLDDALKSLKTTGVRTLVLDIDHHIREQRAQQRKDRETLDHFDRYLAANPELSERMEDFLIWLCQTYLEANKLLNNDLTDRELIAHIHENGWLGSK